MNKLQFDNTCLKDLENKGFTLTFSSDLVVQMPFERAVDVCKQDAPFLWQSLDELYPFGTQLC